MRRVANESFNARAVERYQPSQTKVAIGMVLNIISQHDNWQNSVQLWVVLTVIIRLVSAYYLQSYNIGNSKQRVWMATFRPEVTLG
jgi:hypothetical protein